MLIVLWSCNLITTKDISRGRNIKKNKNLAVMLAVNCTDNLIESLDVSKNRNLYWLICSDNIDNNSPIHLKSRHSVWDGGFCFLRSEIDYTERSRQEKDLSL